MNEGWTQGNWNAFVVFDCDITESRKRCKRAPDKFKGGAIDHARTYWALQENRPAPKPRQKKYPWPVIEITRKHWATGKAHLENSNQQYLKNFGDQAMGFAAEYAVEDWFTGQGIECNHNPNPKNTDPDFTIKGRTIDLKSRQSKMPPRRDFDSSLAENQRIKDEDKGAPDWYLFGYWNNTTEGEYHLMGFQTLPVILDLGVYYNQGDITRGGMRAPVDCWYIYNQELVNAEEWLDIHAKMKSPIDSGEPIGLI
ncbi:MAG: hypothetical protein OES26_09900 [Gammaproteobacteria bacterium]|nr:hypothetical protein [Gammaproteobacteria bacterium]